MAIGVRGPDALREGGGGSEITSDARRARAGSAVSGPDVSRKEGLSKIRKTA